jgi:regulator of sirC expression with transglutaminase-like and TPR domain
MKFDANRVVAESEICLRSESDSRDIDDSIAALAAWKTIDNVTESTLMAIDRMTQSAVSVTALTQLREMIVLMEADMQGLASQSDKLKQLQYLFYQQLGFGCDWRELLTLDSILLHEVIANRNGVPISLGSLFMYFAEHFAVEVKGILFPGQFVLRFGDEKAATYVDPADGQILSRHKLQVLLRGIEGNHALLTDDDLLEADNEMHYLRLLQVLKAALIRDEHFSYALRCIDLILELEPDEPYEIRDRGFLLQQLDCKKLASEDFAYFIEQCPDDPITRVLKAQVEELGDANDTIH